MNKQQDIRWHQRFENFENFEKAYLLLQKGAIIDTPSEIEEAILFGSRAMGTFKEGSDIDLAIKGKNINHHVMARLNNDLQEELPIPFFFDLVDFNTITSTALREHSKRVGIIIYPTYE